MNEQIRNRLGLGAIGGANITPSDSTVFDPPYRGLQVGTAGDIKVTFDNGDVVVLSGVVAGDHPYVVKKVWASSTTALGISGLK